MAKAPAPKLVKSKTANPTLRRKMTPAKLRSRAWFNNPDNADMTALYLERTMNYGLSFEIGRAHV